jgi:signal transduction histidine kinase/CheY-like chemotaxis protein
MRSRSPLARYSVAVSATVVAVLAGAALKAAVNYRLPLIAFYPALMVSAWFGGFWPGMTTTFTSVLIVDWVWLRPLRDAQLTNLSDPLALVLFVFIGLVISGFSESMHRSAARELVARRRAEEREQALIESDHRIRAALAGEEAARAEAESANRLKDQFLAIVSHELRTPLNALLGWADMLRGQILTENRRERAIEAVYANAKREAQLVDDLLDISRMMAGKIELHRAPVDVVEVLYAAREIVQPSADAKRIEITTDIQIPHVTLSADPMRLQQIFWNLLANAIKFTPEHGVINLRARRSDGDIEVTISDSGPGIAANLLGSVFEPFRQGDTSTTRANGGLGLGLAIVKHLVEAHGGTVTAASAGEGRGAAFAVRLPMAVGIGEALAGTPSTAARPTLDGVVVLVVDDDAPSCEVAMTLLQTQGARVLTASSAAEAFDIVEHERPMVLLVDIAMPAEDGYSFIQRVRRAPQHIASIPAVAVTAFAKDEDRERALDAGFQRHLAKPVAASVLVQAVADLIESVHTY